MSDGSPPVIHPNAFQPMPVATKEACGIVAAPAGALQARQSFLDPAMSREEVLERIDPEMLRTAPLNLLTATALAVASPDAAEATEDAVLRYTTALSDPLGAAQAYVRVTAEKLVLADVEYQSALTRCAQVELEAPLRTDWQNPQHYFEAMKLHERRMDRLVRVRKEAFERFERAAELYRVALLTSEGRDILVSLATRRGGAGTGGRIPGQSGVEVVPEGGESTAHTQVRVKIF